MRKWASEEWRRRNHWKSCWRIIHWVSRVSTNTQEKQPVNLSRTAGYGGHIIWVQAPFKTSDISTQLQLFNCWLTQMTINQSGWLAEVLICTWTGKKGNLGDFECGRWCEDYRTCWDFHKTTIWVVLVPERNCPVSCSCVNVNGLLRSEVRGQRRMGSRLVGDDWRTTGMGKHHLWTYNRYNNSIQFNSILFI